MLCINNRKCLIADLISVDGKFWKEEAFMAPVNNFDDTYLPAVPNISGLCP